MTPAASLVIWTPAARVGKTTIAVNLAKEFAKRGEVLLVDCDPQASATKLLGLERPGNITLHQILSNPHLSVSDTTALSTDIPSLLLIPSDLMLAKADMELQGRWHKEYVLREKLEGLLADGYTVVLDAPPGLGMMAVNALAAASHILFPVLCGAHALEGLSLLTDTLDMLQRTFPNFIGTVLNGYDPESEAHRDIRDRLRLEFGNGLLQTHVKSNPSPAEYATLADEVLERIG